MGKKLMKAFIMILMIAVLCLPVGKEVFAAEIKYSGTSGDLKWTIDSDGVLTITGTGDYKVDYSFDKIFLNKQKSWSGGECLVSNDNDMYIKSISKGFCDWMDSLYLGKSRRSFNPKINIPASLPLNVKNSIIKKIQTHFPNSTQEQIDEMIKKTYTSWNTRVESQQFTQAFYNVFNHFSTAPQGYKVGNLRANNKVGEERFDLTKSGIPLDPRFVRIKIYVNDVKDLFNVHFLKQAIPLLKEKPQLLDAPKFNKVSSHLKDVLTIIDKEELLSLTPESFKPQQS